MAVLNLIRLFWWRVFPYISLTYSLCRWNHSLTVLFLDGILFISGRAADLTCASSRPLSDIDRVKGLDAWRECERYVRLIWIHMDLWSTLGPMIWTLVEHNPRSSKVSAKRIGCLDFPVGKFPGFLPLCGHVNWSAPGINSYCAGRGREDTKATRRDGTVRFSRSGWTTDPKLTFTSHGWCTSCNNSRQDVSFYCRCVAVVTWVCVCQLVCQMLSNPLVRVSTLWVFFTQKCVVDASWF